jgi:hypothetical protein
LPDWRFLRNVLLKALLLFVVFNLVFAAWPVAASLGRISAYNLLFPGRPRFPFGEDPAVSYNLSLYNLDAMFASHVLADGPKPASEYRVLLVGDSSVWGTLLRPQDTLAGQLNAAGLTSCDGRRVRFYNLGYPTLSLTKDLMVLSLAMSYPQGAFGQPDLVIWLVTLESFPRNVQLSSPIVANNPALVDGLIQKYGLKLDPNDPALVKPTFWQDTIIGQRRSLADLLRLQLYGVMWAATGIDQDYPQQYTPAQRDFNTDQSFNNWQPPQLPLDQLSFDVLAAGLRAAGPKTPVLLVNEPILISSGKNSDIRYNFYYPRWAYDQYRAALADKSRQAGWNLLDLWNLEAEQQFTNSAIHLTLAGEALLAQRLSAAVQPQLCH